MTRSARVCLVTSSHPVTYSRFLHRQAASLARAGYRVTLIGLPGRETGFSSHGVQLVPVEESRCAGKTQVLRAVARAMNAVRPHVCECLDPWTLALSFAFKRGRSGLRLVYDASEWFSYAFFERTDLPLPVRMAGYAAIESIEYRAVRQADVILDTNATRAKRFLRRGRPVALVPNFPPLGLLPAPVEVRRTEIVFTGLVSRHRGFDRLLTALGLVRRTVPEARLRVMGDFDPRDDLEEECKTFLHTNHLADAVTLQGWLRYDHMLREAAAGLVGVILLQPGRRNDYTGLPNKLFEFMGCGLAVIASDTPEMRRVITETGCGWLVEPTSSGAIARVLEEALSDQRECIRRGRAGRAAVFDRYNWSVAEARLLDCYRQLLK